MRKWQKETFRYIIAMVLIAGLGILSPPQAVQAAMIGGLYNTGVDNGGNALTPGTPEMHYVMTGLPTAGPVEILYPNTNWVTAPDGSAWIGPNNGNDNVTNGNSTAPAGSYSYSLAFDLTGFDLSTVTISGQWATDNSGGIFINGFGTAYVQPQIGAFASLSDFTIDTNFLQGTNTLSFSVFNYPKDDTTSTSPSGLLIANLSGTGTLVPIPSTVWLLGCGAIGLVGLRRKFKR